MAGSTTPLQAQWVRVLTHTGTAEHYGEAKIINDSCDDLQAFHLISVPGPRVYSCAKVFLLPLEHGDENSSWVHGHHAGPRSWLLNTAFFPLKEVDQFVYLKQWHMQL